mmetsp:Transcript_94791/g.306027  ORF Transcript_94791/g.306027 Transcript_94791/m.306027 type:complete len:335 (-) Transcript_94791:850-1854(-)
MRPRKAWPRAAAPRPAPNAPAGSVLLLLPVLLVVGALVLELLALGVAPALAGARAAAREPAVGAGPEHPVHPLVHGPLVRVRLRALDEGHLEVGVDRDRQEDVDEEGYHGEVEVGEERDCPPPVLVEERLHIKGLLARKHEAVERLRPAAELPHAGAPDGVGEEDRAEEDGPEYGQDEVRELVQGLGEGLEELEDCGRHPHEGRETHHQQQQEAGLADCELLTHGRSNRVGVERCEIGGQRWAAPQAHELDGEERRDGEHVDKTPGREDVEEAGLAHVHLPQRLPVEPGRHDVGDDDDPAHDVQGVGHAVAVDLTDVEGHDAVGRVDGTAGRNL